MAVGKLLNIFALSSLAVLVCNLGVTPVSALSAHGAHLQKREHAHGAIAKRSRGKRDNTQRCKTRSSTDVQSSTAAAASPSSSVWTSSSVWSSDTQVATTTQIQATTSVSTSAAAATSSSSSGSSSGSGVFSGSGKIGIAWGGGSSSQLDGLLTNNVK